MLFDSYRVSNAQPADLDGARHFMRARLEQRDSVVILAAESAPAEGATKAQVALGFAQLYPSFSSSAMRRIWILNDLFVAAEHRRNGVGTALLNAAAAYARGDNARRVILATAADNLAAQALYERCGYRRDAFFHYQLDVDDR